MKKIYFFLFLNLLTFALKAQPPATLDPAFDNDGIVSYPTPMSTLPQVKSEHLIQPDGKIVICGTSLTAFFEGEIMVARFNNDGSPDTGFGNNGTFRVPVITGYNLAVGLDLQPDGKIVTSGIYNDGSGTAFNEIFILRLKTNGTLDSSFGTNGLSHWNPSPEEERITDMKRTTDGSFILCGFIITTVSADSAFLMKVKPNGTPDSSFGTNGMLRYQYNGMQTDLYSVETLPDGTLITGGSVASTNGTYQNIFIMKLDNSGSFVSGFGAGGVYTLDLFSDYDEIHTLKRLSNGDILASGYAYNDFVGFNDGSFVVKLSSTGVRYNNFGTNGIAYFSTPNTPNRAYDMDVAADGKIVLAGQWYNNTTFDDDFMVLRLLADGTPDPSFNNGEAYVTLDFLNEYDEAYSVLVQPDGKILVYGTAYLDVTAQDLSPVLVRYIGDAIILPLQLVNFEGKQSKNDVLLSWTTSHESNTGYFEVERSSDASHFEKIAQVAAKNNELVNNYHVTDPAVKQQTLYYRLKMVDKDGKYSYSQVISFHLEKDELLVYPTITNALLNIQTTKEKDFKLYNSSGHLVRSLTAGENNISSLPSGIYYLKTNGKVIAVTKQ